MFLFSIFGLAWRNLTFRAQRVNTGPLIMGSPTPPPPPAGGSYMTGIGNGDGTRNRGRDRGRKGTRELSLGKWRCNLCSWEMGNRKWEWEMESGSGASGEGRAGRKPTVPTYHLRRGKLRLRIQRQVPWNRCRESVKPSIEPG